MNTAEGASTAITIRDAPTADAAAKERAPVAPVAAAAAAKRTSRFAAIFKKTRAKGGSRRCLALFDLILRLCAIGATLTAAIVMGTTDETLPFFTAYFQFHAEYSDLPALTFFVIANAISAGYLVLSLPCSFISLIRPRAVCPRLLLLISDTVMLALTTAAASSAAAIVYLAHNGDESANWVAICLRFDGFCESISGAVVASFIAVLVFMLLVFFSALALRKH